MEEIIYENKTGVEQIKTEHQKYWTIEKITIDDGIKQWMKGASFPSRGMTLPESMFACNQVKRLFIESIRLFTWRLLLVKWSRLIEVFTDMSWKIMSPFIIKYQYLTPIAQEIQDIVYGFLIREGFNETVALQFSKIFSHLIEYDNAYRFRVQDIMNETDSVRLSKNPRKEIKRLIKLIIERDSPGTADKFVKIGKLINIVLLVPSVRRKFRNCIEESNFEKLQVDDLTWYWMCFREDYKFGGLSNEERKVEFNKRGWVIPKGEKIC